MLIWGVMKSWWTFEALKDKSFWTTTLVQWRRVRVAFLAAWPVRVARWRQRTCCTPIGMIVCRATSTVTYCKPRLDVRG